MAQTTEQLPVVVVGGGQAGLAAGHYLRRKEIPFAIIDSHLRVGDPWRRRWQSLRLFTPARIDGLPGLRFPADATAHPTKEEMASYLEVYATHFDLPVRSGITATRLARAGNAFEIDTSEGRLTAAQVILATGSNQVPKVPSWAGSLSPEVKQLTAASYGSTADLHPGDVLVVGAGNSGSEIALEAAAAGHRVFLSGRDTGRGNPALFRRVPWWLGSHLLTTSTPMGRRMAARMASGGAPRFWIEPEHLAAAGIERVARTVDAEGGRPRLEDGSQRDVANVIWCTGFTQDFSWIDPAALDPRGRPLQQRGVSVIPGLYFLGLPFQHSVASTLVGGVSRDARHVVGQVARSVRRTLSPRSSSSAESLVTAE